MSRINYYQAAPEAINKLAGVNKYLESSSLDPLLRALVEIRVSQINGCVYCVDLPCAKGCGRRAPGATARTTSKRRSFAEAFPEECARSLAILLSACSHRGETGHEDASAWPQVFDGRNDSFRREPSSEACDCSGEGSFTADAGQLPLGKPAGQCCLDVYMDLGKWKAIRALHSAGQTRR